MKKGVVVTVLILTGMASASTANTNQMSANQTSDVPLLTALQNETAVDHMSIKHPEVKELLKNVFRKMEASDAEIKAFADRKGAQKVKSGFWTVSEECETNGVIVCMKVDFFTETGPIRFGAKVVYQDKTYRKDLKTQRYKIYYHENGKVQTFLTADPVVTLQFYPSGRVKQFCLSAADNSMIAAFDGGDDDSIKHEVYNGFKTDKDKVGKP